MQEIRGESSRPQHSFVLSIPVTLGKSMCLHTVCSDPGLHFPSPTIASPSGSYVGQETPQARPRTDNSVMPCSLSAETVLTYCSYIPLPHINSFHIYHFPNLPPQAHLFLPSLVPISRAHLLKAVFHRTWVLLLLLLVG